MMEYQTLLDGMGLPENADLCANLFGLPREAIHDNVILSPGWEPSALAALGKAEPVSVAPLFGYKLWSIRNSDTKITWVRTGFGAPVVMDAALILGVSGCKRILFVSSVGMLQPGVQIGDLVLPEFSMNGDGASRYIASADLRRDILREKAYPDAVLLERLRESTRVVCTKRNVDWYMGWVFCTDTIFAQHPHLSAIQQMGCSALDMESAAAFRAAALTGIPTAALLSVSDNITDGKSLMFSGRGYSSTDAQYRRFVRSTVMPEIILRVFRSFQS